MTQARWKQGPTRPEVKERYIGTVADIDVYWTSLVEFTGAIIPIRGTETIYKLVFGNQGHARHGMTRAEIAEKAATCERYAAVQALLAIRGER